MRRICILLAVICFICMVIVPAFSQSGVKVVSSGEYTDKDGTIHPWKVNGSHTLLWEGQPYIPVGYTFCSKYVSDDQTEDNWQSDVKLLDGMKAKGITDVLLKSKNPITSTSPAAWQRLINHLDLMGFTYGIELSDGPKATLAGFVIAPTRYRMPDIIKDTDFTFDMPNVTSAFWMLCSASDGTVVNSGGALVSDGKVKVSIKAVPGQSCIMLLYPKMAVLDKNQRGMSDDWNGFDEYRDRLLKFLSGMKFGKGLRFFVDPLADKMDFSGEVESFIPDSSNFRLEYEAYLAKKYLNIGSLNNAWGLQGSFINSFQEAARLLPLWKDGRGIPCVYDRARGQRFVADNLRSTIWDDMEHFRDSSAQNYMNLAADVLKRNGANVPVIYNADNYHRVYANSVSGKGFDGLGVASTEHGAAIVENSAGSAYSLCEESARSMWYVVTGIGSGDNKESLAADIDSVREIGAKGAFIDSDSNPTAEQIDWLNNAKAKFTSASQTDYAPNVVYYPVEPVVGATITRLGQGSWWLPSLKSGSKVSFGDGFGAYVLSGQDGICLWSRMGDMTASFSVDKNSRPKILYPSDSNRIAKTSKNKLTINLGATPVLFTGLDNVQSFPIEAVESEIDRLVPMIERAKNAGSTRIPAVQSGVARVKDVLKAGRTAVAYDIAKTFVSQIAEEIGSYCWIEGEQATSNSFNGIAASPMASAGGYIKLDTATAPPMSEYSARFLFQMTKESPCEIWVAGTAPGADTSPFSYSIDNGPWQQAEVSSTGKSYANGFSWFRIGSVNLTKDAHLLQIRVDGPNATGRYKLGIDAIVVSPFEFKPNGVKQP